MATTIDIDMVMQPAEAAWANMEDALNKTADMVGEAAYLPAGMRNGLMALVAAGQANVDGARQIRHEIAGYAKANMDAHIGAAKASMQAKTLDAAMSVQRAHMTAMMNDGVAQGGKLAELALAISEKTAAPLRKQTEGPWTAWFQTAA